MHLRAVLVLLLKALLSPAATGKLGYFQRLRFSLLPGLNDSSGTVYFCEIVCSNKPNFQLCQSLARQTLTLTAYCTKVFLTSLHTYVSQGNLDFTEESQKRWFKWSSGGLVVISYSYTTPDKYLHNHVLKNTQWQRSCLFPAQSSQPSHWEDSLSSIKCLPCLLGAKTSPRTRKTDYSSPFVARYKVNLSFLCLLWMAHHHLEPRVLQRSPISSAASSSTESDHAAMQF